MTGEYMRGTCIESSAKKKKKSSKLRRPWVQKLLYVDNINVEKYNILCTKSQGFD